MEVSYVEGLANHNGPESCGAAREGGVATQAIGYTADGRMNRLNPGIQAPGGRYITSLGYNQDARLAAVISGSGSLASYIYDGFGQRIVKTFSSGSAGNIYQSGQDGMLLEETNASGAAQADYIYLRWPTRGRAQRLDSLLPAHRSPGKAPTRHRQ